MKQLLIDTLEEVTPDNVYLQGTLAEDKPYPDEFITYNTDLTNDTSHYDNDVAKTDWQFSVMYYTSDRQKMLTQVPLIISKLKAKGFLIDGKGNDIPSDRPSHTGWAMDFIITEFNS